MSKTIKLPVLSLTAAYTLNKELRDKGIPTIDRVLIAVSNKDFTTASGIIIPGGNKEEVPKKGTVIQKGLISSDYRHIDELIQIGSVVTYGNYAGKKVEPIDVEGFDLMVLSITEICYIERNPEYSEKQSSIKKESGEITKEYLVNKSEVYKDIYLRTVKVISDTLDILENDIYPYSSITNDMGADSLDLVELTMNIEKEFRISLPDKELKDIEDDKVVTIIEYLYKKLN